ncbi:hypothetical protein C366_05682 [Cryptococcus neoformans Tu401-1]|nr:hypothetical protein C353_05691 [Cryptococcus neoformans var. grubii AD1-83a]OWZ76200.1 hypothetical protein C365_05618 [Cryptococcus neoformans var. grubii Bt85]OXG12862.1 hypothetical protein C366_05682 [Cryptococcus neoformans var. grubii Tu401-1]OXG51006.1 hypothetical protein C354_05633 [Cryptococcus neoformans var. grubii MW-RSA1955]OXG55203.1 hypothetical protein C352_05614 [Cryptococcus neoformans var. grubii CHC193]OXG59248.1 hypothetical protein C351_05538 [Cryptococcus neoformans
MIMILLLLWSQKSHISPERSSPLSVANSPLDIMSPSQQQTSVFNALGSYADRIKDANGNFIKSSPSSSSSATPEPTSLSSSTSGKKAFSTATFKSGQQKQGSSPQPGAITAEDDGPWETVQSTRARQRTDRSEEKEKRGSSSKNWRERSHRDEKNQDDGEKRNGRERSKKEKGDKSNSAPFVGSATSSEKTAKSLSSSTKNAWGVTSSSQGENPIASNPGPKQKAQNDSTFRSSSAAAPVGPTTSTINEIIKQSEGSDEDNWRARPAKVEKNEKTEGPVSITQAQPQPQRQLAPPPSVNIWDLRKKMSVPVLFSPTSATSAVAGIPPKSDKEKSLTNGMVKEEDSGTGKSLSKKKSAAAAAAAGTSSAPPSIHDATLWPDIVQAAEVVKAGEDKKEKAKERLNSESASVAEESTIGIGKKPKWTPIPAHELLAAADHAAEQSRRQNRMEAKKRSSGREGGESGPTGSGAPGKSNKTRKGMPAAEGKKARKEGAQQKDGHASSKAGETIGAGTGKANGDVKETKEGDARSASQQESSSHRSGPSISASANTGIDSSLHARTKSTPNASTTPLPPHTFNLASSSNLPRSTRGRGEGRGSFGGGRARGGFRSSGALGHKGQLGHGHGHVHGQGQGFGYGYGSPPMGVAGLPVEGIIYAPLNPGAGAGAGASPNLYQRGYGMGFQPFYPAATAAASAGEGGPTGAAAGDAAGVYDPAAAVYGNMGMYKSASMPPPPMPQTVVPNLDPLRFYVLGQVEYYFSMQNLAMDFFLRQQMDSEGWIDIAMIASFNRIKSLTPETSIVRECMILSNYLEVREDKVRLSGAESHRWVLPDAAPSKFGPDPRSPSLAEGAESSEERDGAASGSQSGLVTAGEEGAQGLQASPRRMFGAQDVKDALMKSSALSTVNGEIKEKEEVKAMENEGEESENYEQ